MQRFQKLVFRWVCSCMGDRVAQDKEERTARFGEEALELCQAAGMSKGDVLVLVDYVYGRDKGEIKQEVGGVMVTLAALCSARSIDLDEAAWFELMRCHEKIDKIRAKHDSKPLDVRGPTPGSRAAQARGLSKAPLFQTWIARRHDDHSLPVFDDHEVLTRICLACGVSKIEKLDTEEYAKEIWERMVRAYVRGDLE